MTDNPRSARRSFRVTLIGDETIEVQTRYSDLLTTERTLISAGLSADPRNNPVHYTTCLLWAALVRTNQTAAKWRDFPDMLEDFDEIDDDQDSLPFPTISEALTRESSG